MKIVLMTLAMFFVSSCIGPCAPQWAKWNGEARIIKLESEGMALRVKAENERKVLVEQARAEKESAQLRADAIKIVGQAAKQYPEYRQQEFMGAFGEALKNKDVDKIIYVPTEANIPIIEAGKR